MNRNMNLVGRKNNLGSKKKMKGKNNRSGMNEAFAYFFAKIVSIVYSSIRTFHLHVKIM
jgi:hypothetical protein